MPDGASTAHLFRPKLVTVLSEGYDGAKLQRDMFAALTVAIVALPLSMAIAIASGVGPERGLYTSIVGGFVVSALGGSRFQIGGPAAAFITLVAATVARYGIDGLLTAVLLSGVLLTLLGLSRLGRLIRFIPHPVTVGFTCGIALMIAVSQLKDFCGLVLPGREPGPLLAKIAAMGQAAGTLNPHALGIGLGSVCLIQFLRAVRPSWPGMILAVALASVVAAIFHLPVDTIGRHFGGIPSHLPRPALPPLGWERVIMLLPSAFSFTLLGGIESLLSARVADGMTARNHRYNMELTAQGLANMGSALFGGINVTGTIARTATNVRAGACSPLSGMMHAVILLIFMIVAAPLARFVPLAALAGVLLVVAWHMAERRELVRLGRDWRGASILCLTLALTVVRDLTVGIAAGCLLAALLAWRPAKRDRQL
jgi:SulP family sulfate permease